MIVRRDVHPCVQRIWILFFLIFRPRQMQADENR